MNKIINEFQSQINNPEIRIWRIKDDNEWVYSSQSGIAILSKYEKQETLTASTYFKDVNNRDIFVGDIVEYIDKFDNNKSIGVVSYDDLNNTIPIIKQAVKLKNGEWKLVSSIPLEYTKNIKVVGNIWDNVEILLKN